MQFRGFTLATLLLAAPALAQAQMQDRRQCELAALYRRRLRQPLRPQDQINASNFYKLEVAWHFKTDDLGTRPEYKLEGTPIEVNGMVYTTAGSRRAVVALDAATGELKWVHGENEGARGAVAPRQLSGRGVSYWTDGNGDERIIYITPGYRLVALNAKTGQPIEAFGDHGVVDLKAAYRRSSRGLSRSISPPAKSACTPRRPWWATPCWWVRPSSEGFTPAAAEQHQGLGPRLRRAGPASKLWTFHNIPQKGEPGYDSWLNNSADYQRQHRRLDRDHRRSGTGHRLSAGRRSPPTTSMAATRPGNDLYRQQPGGGGPQDRQDEMVLPVHPSPDLGL